MTVVMTVGSIMFGIGAITLFIAFRAFGGAKAGKPAHLALIAGLVVFLAMCCLLLLRIS
jgi:hypothetical protein